MGNEIGACRSVRGCEVLWGKAKADRVQGAIERAVGGPCSCIRGERCPLLPEHPRLVVTREEAPEAVHRRAV